MDGLPRRDAEVLLLKLLLQYLTEGLFVEADDQFFADSQNGRPQRSRPAQNQTGNFILVVVRLQVEVNELFAPRHVQLLHPVEQLERIVAFITNFPGIDFFDRVDIVVRKKLLRFFAGRSARSMVAPVNFRHRHFSL
jgi:hypothetical protein